MSNLTYDDLKDMIIDNIFSLLEVSIEVGALYGIVVLGFILSFRITGFADLTIEGSFTTGAAVNAILILAGIPPSIALLLAAIVGSLAGMITALLHVKVGVSKLLAGVIMMTILYSVNLRIMGKPNLSLLDQPVIFDIFNSEMLKIFIVLFAALTCFFLLYAMLRTDFGFFLRTTGEKSRVVEKLGVNTATFTIAGLMMSNALVAFSGGLTAQHHGFVDIGMGTGIIIVAFASALIGESIIGPQSVPRLLLAALLGSIIYQLIIAICLRLGIGPWDLKLATGILVILAVSLKKALDSGKPVHNIGREVL